MIFAATGDIAGNFRAFSAVVNTLEEAGIPTLLHTGNTIKGAQKQEGILTLLQQSNAVVAQGNRDRLLARFHRKRESLRKRLEPEEYRLLEETAAAISGSDLEWLASLPPKVTLTLEGKRVLLCHGSPSNPRRGLDGGTPLKLFQREREASACDIVVCGSEEPFQCSVDDTLFVGAGPVPLEEGCAAYTLISTENYPWHASVHHVRYD